MGQTGYSKGAACAFKTFTPPADGFLVTELDRPNPGVPRSGDTAEGVGDDHDQGDVPHVW